MVGQSWKMTFWTWRQFRICLFSNAIWWRPYGLKFAISCDMVQPCDTTQARLNLDFGVKVSTVQFYDIEHNSKSNSWIKLKLYHNISEIVFYVEVNFKVNQSSERTCDIGENRLYIYFLLTRELLIWQGSF